MYIYFMTGEFNYYPEGGLENALLTGDKNFILNNWEFGWEKAKARLLDSVDLYRISKEDLLSGGFEMEHINLYSGEVRNIEEQIKKKVIGFLKKEDE